MTETTVDRLGPELRRRVELTVSCRDCDHIAKVDRAGEVVDGLQIMHNGVRVVAGGYYGDWMTEIIRRLRGHHEPQEELAFHAVVERLAEDAPRSAVIVELGAFWAYYSLWLLQRIPAGRAILIEPDPANLAIGRRNFAINGREGLFIQAAVGAGPGDPAPFVCESDGVSRELPTESVPSIMAKAGLDGIEILLADVQGAELGVLQGARELLRAGRVRFVVISTHHYSISHDPFTHQRCLAVVREGGGHVIAEHQVSESFSGDGLIVASFHARDRDLNVRVSHARPEESLFAEQRKETTPDSNARGPAANPPNFREEQTAPGPPHRALRMSLSRRISAFWVKGRMTGRTAKEDEGQQR